MTRFLASVLVTLFLACLALVANAATPPKPRPPSPVEVALASPVPVWQRAGILVEQGGRALYTYTADVPGQSNCDAKCEALWPPHYAEPDAQPHGPFTIARSFDGRPMWAWQGKPLYRWISDRRRGAAGGDGVADVWFLVRVPPALSAEVTRYFPMPTPRPGASTSTPSTSDLSRKR
jgi:predicted lipoprotein with Yx(FWY)xxD motif